MIFDRPTRLFALIFVLSLFAIWAQTSIWTRLFWVWVTVNFAFVAFTFSLNRPRWLGKQSNGRLSLLSLFLLAPYHVFNFLSLGLLWKSQKSLLIEIAPNLWLGARLPRGKEPLFEFVVDLCAELSENAVLRAADTYLSVPTLDMRAPEDLRPLSQTINRQRKEGKVFVHCAAGRGRSASLVAATLLESGEARDVVEAIEIIHAKRHVEMKDAQLQALKALET